MTASGYRFRVRPTALAAFAGSARTAATRLDATHATLAADSVAPGWFGKLPQSGILADRYLTHREAELAAIADLSLILAAVADAIEGVGRQYEAADSVVTDVADAIGRSRDAAWTP